MSLFDEDEIADYLRRNGFEVEFIESRLPYDDEIQRERIYGIGIKA